MEYWLIKIIAFYWFMVAEINPVENMVSCIWGYCVEKIVRDLSCEIFNYATSI